MNPVGEMDVGSTELKFDDDDKKPGIMWVGGSGRTVRPGRQQQKESTTEKTETTFETSIGVRGSAKEDERREEARAKVEFNRNNHYFSVETEAEITRKSGEKSETSAGIQAKYGCHF